MKSPIYLNNKKKNNEKNAPLRRFSLGVGVCTKIPTTPGVYLMKNAKGEILYVGKAVNLKRRVSSYFSKSHDYRIEKLVSQIKKIDYEKTDTALEALILESQLIKKYLPPFNIRDKDGKSFLYVEITKEEFPRVLLVRGADKVEGERFGPFIYAKNIREGMKIIRNIFPYSIHPPEKIGKYPRPCFEYEIRVCPGTCIAEISRAEYMKTISHIKLFLKGKKGRLLQALKKEMNEAAKKLEYEEAEKLRRQVFALEHIRDIALITNEKPIVESNETGRIEGYDISNISGTSAVGSMVVFINGKPDKGQYRKFKIHPPTTTKTAQEVRVSCQSSFGVGVRTIPKQDDVGMIKQVLSRRFKHPEWPYPNVILIDGGKGQVNAARSVLEKNSLKIPVVGIAKGPKRNKNEFVGDFKPLHQVTDRSNSVTNKNPTISRKTLIQVRDEAHRFAMKYHRTLRNKRTLT